MVPAGIRRSTGQGILAKFLDHRTDNTRSVPHRVVDEFHAPLPLLLPAVLADSVTLRQSAETTTDLTATAG